MNGLSYIPFFLSSKEEQDLIAKIDSNLWITDLQRRTQHYGYKYDYTKKKIDDSLYLGPLPEWLNEITKQISQSGNYHKLPDQVIINEYTPGQGIAPHIDCRPCFGDTVSSVSLLSTVRMNFSKFDELDLSILLEPRSLLILTGDARNNWNHGIARVSADIINTVPVERHRRVSLTFRTIR